MATKREIASFLIPRETTVKQAMKTFETTEERILFVVDRGLHLFGSLTDGDIRRWILADRKLDGPVGEACNPSPRFVTPGYDVRRVKEIMLEHNINCVPVLNEDHEVLDLLFWTDLFQSELTRRKLPPDLPVVVMAGGRGTRLDPFTRILPKPLIPIGDKTVIEIILDSFQRFGVASFYLSIHSKARIIKSYFEELAPPYSITYLEEIEPLGTAGALRLLAGKVRGPLIMTNCDVLVKADYSDLVAHHRAKRNDMTIVTCMKSYRIPYGICRIENGGVLAEITEKPEYDLLVSTGMYVIESDRLDLIPEGRAFDVPELVDELRKQGGRVGVYPVGERDWLDTGEWSEYRKTMENLQFDSMSERRED